MQTIITNKLTDIAAERGIRILFACESGSRGWQFPSPDSDYDVRFIYACPMDDYLTVADRDEQIGFPINDELDILGWDIRKVLRLKQKSNTTPFEWLQSPIVYMQQPGFRSAGCLFQKNDKRLLDFPSVSTLDSFPVDTGK